MSQADDRIEELERVVEQLTQRLQRAEADLSRLTSPFGRILLVRRGGEDGTHPLQWKEQTVVGGEIVEFEDGRQCEDDEADERLREPGSVVVALEVPDNEGHTYVRLPSERLFPVTLVQSGGGNGSATTTANYTYTATDENGEEVGTGLSPQMPLRTVGQWSAANKGWCYYTSAGVLTLAICNEGEAARQCP